MSMNLISHNPAVPSAAAANWAAIQAVASEGLVYIADATVNAIARAIEDARLSNGQTVTAYAYDDEGYASFVPGFGVCLLSEEDFRTVRTLIEEDANGVQAVAMLDLLIELRLQVSFSGTDFIGARLKAVNWAADEVEISLSSGNMYKMLKRLGIQYDTVAESGEVKLAVFERAVNDNAFDTDMPAKLQDFVACAKRRNDTAVYWA